MNRCFLNGELMPLSEAKISPMDRGFLFGDGVYEVVPVYQRRLFCWQRHMRRLQRNLSEIGMGYSVGELQTPAQELIQEAETGDLSLYVQITRGATQKRAHAFPDPQPEPTVFMFASPRAPMSAAKLQGVSCQTMEEFRWLRADIKSVSLLGAVLIAQTAAQSRSEEIILIRDNCATEAAACNIFIASGETLVTPPVDHRILPGISREIVLELAQRAGIPCQERDISRAELAAANEIMITSSTREILPVIQLDGAKVHDGKPGPVFAALHSAFQKFVADGEE